MESSPVFSGFTSPNNLEDLTVNSFFLVYHLDVFFLLFFKVDFILFQERGRERERNINVRKKCRWAASCLCSNRGSSWNLGMRPDWELNWQPFGYWTDAPTD